MKYKEFFRKTSFYCSEIIEYFQQTQEPD